MEKVANIEFNTSGSTLTPKVGSLRCDKPNHEKNYYKYVCLKNGCEKKKLNCAHCYIEEHIGQNDIKTTLEEFEADFKKNYTNLAQTITELGLSRSTDPTDNELSELIKKFDTMKLEFCDKIENLKLRVIDDFQKLVFTTEVENIRHLARKVVDNNALLQMTDFKGLTEDEFVKFVDMHLYTFKDDQDILGRLSFVQTNVKVCYGKLLNNMEKFKAKMFDLFDEHIIPVMSIHIEDNLAAGKYKIHHKGCEDFPMLRFVPIFPCCDRSYPCAKCHDKAEKHKAKPALQVYCIKCKYMLENKYSLLKCPRCTEFADKL